MKSHEEAREFDTRLAAVYTANEKVVSQVDSAMTMLHYRAGDRKTWVGRSHVWQMSHKEAVAKCREIAYGTKSDSRPAALELVNWHELTERHHELVDQISAQERIYAADPWSRFILCLSHDGHIHAATGCSTLRWDSRLEWHPEFSGLTEEQAINGYGDTQGLGPILCTVCFPSAPVEHKRNPSEWKRERDAGAIAARKIERETAKYAKRLYPNEEIRFHDGFSTERIETVNACKEALRKEVEFRDYYGGGEHPCHKAYVEAAPRIIEVLLAREARTPGTGATQEQIDTLIANAVKRNRKDGARI